MLSSIHPFGERARNQNYWLTVVAYAVGAFAGGLNLGATLALLAVPIPTEPWTAVAAIAVLVASAVWDISGTRVPTLQRQVDEDWLPRYRGWVYGLGYGAQLGVGFATYVKSPLTYGYAIACVLSGDPRIGIVGGAVFGAVRGLSILATSKVHSPRDLRTLFSRLASADKAMRWAGSTVVLIIAVVGMAGLA